MIDELELINMIETEMAVAPYTKGYEEERLAAYRAGLQKAKDLARSLTGIWRTNRAGIPVWRE